MKPRNYIATKYSNNSTVSLNSATNLDKVPLKRDGGGQDINLDLNVETCKL